MDSSFVDRFCSVSLRDLKVKTKRGIDLHGTHAEHATQHLSLPKLGPVRNPVRHSFLRRSQPEKTTQGQVRQALFLRRSQPEQTTLSRAPSIPTPCQSSKQENCSKLTVGHDGQEQKNSNDNHERNREAEAVVRVIPFHGFPMPCVRKPPSPFPLRMTRTSSVNDIKSWKAKHGKDGTRKEKETAKETKTSTLNPSLRPKQPLSQFMSVKQEKQKYRDYRNGVEAKKSTLNPSLRPKQSLSEFMSVKQEKQQYRDYRNGVDMLTLASVPTSGAHAKQSVELKSSNSKTVTFFSMPSLVTQQETNGSNGSNSAPTKSVRRVHFLFDQETLDPVSAIIKGNNDDWRGYKHESIWYTRAEMEKMENMARAVVKFFIKHRLDYTDATTQLALRLSKSNLSSHLTSKNLKLIADDTVRGLESDIITVLRTRQRRSIAVVLQTQQLDYDQKQQVAERGEYLPPTTNTTNGLIASKYKRHSQFAILWARLLAEGDACTARELP